MACGWFVSGRKVHTNNVFMLKDTHDDPLMFSNVICVGARICAHNAKLCLCAHLHAQTFHHSLQRNVFVRFSTHKQNLC